MSLSLLDTVLNPNVVLNSVYGQVFDDYVFVADLIKSAKKSVILIDNYIDESVLYILSKREKGVMATVYTSNLTKQLQLDLNYENFETIYALILNR